MTFCFRFVKLASIPIERDAVDHWRLPSSWDGGTSVRVNVLKKFVYGPTPYSISLQKNLFEWPSTSTSCNSSKGTAAISNSKGDTNTRCRLVFAPPIWVGKVWKFRSKMILKKLYTKNEGKENTFFKKNSSRGCSGTFVVSDSWSRLNCRSIAVLQTTEETSNRLQATDPRGIHIKNTY